MTEERLKEIKEILDIERYRNKDGYVENISLMPDEIHKLLDYITNLQEENERLNNIIRIMKEELIFDGHTEEWVEKIELKGSDKE